MALEGKLTGKRYRLGMKLNIRVARVDIDDRKIDFQLEKKLPPLHRKTHQKSAQQNIPAQNSDTKKSKPKPKTSKSRTAKKVTKSARRKRK
mgnify:FL=1